MYTRIEKTTDTALMQRSKTNIHGCIAGSGSVTGNRIVTNEELSKKCDTSDDWIVERTGIRQRFFNASSSENAAAELGAVAALEAMVKSGIDSDAIDCVICSTFTPDHFFPSTACVIQGLLGIGHAFAFDISAACSGFIYGLEIGNGLIVSGRCRNVLLVSVELSSRVLDWNDRSTCILFGDAAGAVVLSAGGGDDVERERGILSSYVASIPDRRSMLTLPAFGERRFIAMKGSEVYKNALTLIVDASVKCLAQCGLTADAVDFYLPHQANARIIRATAETIGIAPEKVVCTVDMFANTGSASIPVALGAMIKDGIIREGATILMASIGGGLTIGSAVVRL